MVTKINYANSLITIALESLECWKQLHVGSPEYKCRVTRHPPETPRVTRPLVPGHLPEAFLGEAVRLPLGGG
jgi:hypothetical protein